MHADNSSSEDLTTVADAMAFTLKWGLTWWLFQPLWIMLKKYDGGDPTKTKHIQSFLDTQKGKYVSFIWI